jgi:membrane protease YdiL (CAAX protease family)
MLVSGFFRTLCDQSTLPDSEMNPPVFALACLITGFLVCHFVPTHQAIQQYFSSKAEKESEDNSRFVLFQRLTGVFFYGFLPLFVIALSGSGYAVFGLNFNKPVFVLVTGGSIGVVLLAINFLNRRNPANLAAYPQIRKKEWSIALLVLSTLSWLTYLFSYEFLFRGYLLFGMAEAYGPFHAVAINVVIYSLVHVPKGWKEAIGSLPLGLLFCYICLQASNIWPAFIAHAFLALSNEWFALKVHPSISLVNDKKS